MLFYSIASQPWAKRRKRTEKKGARFQANRGSCFGWEGGRDWNKKFEENGMA